MAPTPGLLASARFEGGHAMDTLSGQIGAIAWLALCGWAMWFGGRAERFAAGALIVAWLATLVVYTDGAALARAHPGWGVFVIDSVLFLVLAAIAVRADRTWLTMAVGLQAIVVLVHLVSLLDARIMTISHVVAQTIATFGVLVCVAISAGQRAPEIHHGRV